MLSIPIFLIGLYFSWLILLFGAQVAYALQNRKMYLQERKAESVNQRGREYVAVRVMAYLALVWSIFGYSIAATRLAMLALAAAGMVAVFLLSIQLCRGLSVTCQRRSMSFCLWANSSSSAAATAVDNSST